MKHYITAVLSIIIQQSFAQWNVNTSINTSVAMAAKSQQNIHSVSDTKKGCVSVWDDNRTSTTTGTDIYAQRMKADGTPKWAVDGVAICNELGTQKSNNITSGGIDGSSIITWEDSRAGNYDIYAQKIDSLGNVLWGTNGIIICNKSTNQKNPKIVDDNAGGAIIVWEDSASFYFDVYAQRINSAGIVQWATNGVAICIAPNQQQNPTLDADGTGGSIITWQDKRSNVDYDIYAQKINSMGVIQWTTNGIVVCNATNTQSNPRIEPDGSNGAYIGWVDKRNALNYDIYAQRISTTGAILWSTNGNLVSGAANNQSALDMKFNGTNLVLTWKDDRVGFYGVFTQVISPLGTSLLTTDGVKISGTLKSINPNAINDGTGNVIVVWQDSTSVGWDIISQKLNVTGSPLWAAGGVIVSNATNDQINASNVSDGNGGAIYSWEDKRNTVDNDIYAQHLFYNGNTFVGLNELSHTNIKAVCYPNPVTNNSIIKLDNNINHQDWTIDVYNTLGQIIEHQKLNNKQVFDITTTRFLDGMYFYTITLRDNSTTKGNFIISKQ